MPLGEVMSPVTWKDHVAVEVDVSREMVVMTGTGEVWVLDGEVRFYFVYTIVGHV
jgi:hypothetical protein